MAELAGVRQMPAIPSHKIVALVERCQREADLRAHARGQHAQRQIKRARRRLEQITQQSFARFGHRQYETRKPPRKSAPDYATGLLWRSDDLLRFLDELLRLWRTCYGFGTSCYGARPTCYAFRAACYADGMSCHGFGRLAMTFGRVAMPLGRVAVAKTLIFWAKRPFATGFGGLAVVKKR